MGVVDTRPFFLNPDHPAPTVVFFDGVIDAGKEGQKLVADTLVDFFGTY